MAFAVGSLFSGRLTLGAAEPAGANTFTFCILLPRLGMLGPPALMGSLIFGLGWAPGLGKRPAGVGPGVDVGHWMPRGS